MKIIFLCGCLELGHDGVGDYTRRLAGEVKRRGHEVCAVALKDFYVEDALMEVQNTEEISLDVLRLPASWPPKKRFSFAKKWLDNFNPVFISLQFVPFAFHSKGVPFTLIGHLTKLGGKRRWHIMFHELWVGMAKSSSKKEIIWGEIQRRLIKLLLSRLKPTYVHTQTEVYQFQLAKLGIKAKFLPLFSNIQNFSASKEYKPNKHPSHNNGPISMVIFGSIHPLAPLDDFTLELLNYVTARNTPFMMTFLGRCGNEEARWTNRFKSLGLPIKIMGEQSPEIISHTLTSATVGITTTPLLLTGKSGTVAAMLEHGLPVICVSKLWELPKMKGFTANATICDYRVGNLAQCLSNRNFVSNSSNKISAVAGQFLQTLLVDI